MANPTWPAGLPNPEYGWNEGEVDGMIIRSDNDAGVAKQRLRYTAVATPITSTITFTRAEYITFRDFVKDTLKYVLPFDWSDMLTDVGTVTYRFTKKPQASRVGFDQVQVTMNLERMP